jgi:hypothetical protein
MLIQSCSIILSFFFSFFSLHYSINISGQFLEHFLIDCPPLFLLFSCLLFSLLSPNSLSLNCVCHFISHLPSFHSSFRSILLLLALPHSPLFPPSDRSYKSIRPRTRSRIRLLPLVNRTHRQGRGRGGGRGGGGGRDLGPVFGIKAVRMPF